MVRYLFERRFQYKSTVLSLLSRNPKKTKKNSKQNATPAEFRSPSLLRAEDPLSGLVSLSLFLCVRKKIFTLRIFFLVNGNCPYNKFSPSVVLLYHESTTLSPLLVHSGYSYYGLHSLCPSFTLNLVI